MNSYFRLNSEQVGSCVHSRLQQSVKIELEDFEKCIVCLPCCSSLFDAIPRFSAGIYSDQSRTAHRPALAASDCRHYQSNSAKSGSSCKCP